MNCKNLCNVLTFKFNNDFCILTSTLSNLFYIIKKELLNATINFFFNFFRAEVESSMYINEDDSFIIKQLKETILKNK